MKTNPEATCRRFPAAFSLTEVVIAMGVAADTLADFCTSNTDDEAHVLQLLETYWKSSLSQFVYM
jgi:hypothetical protein